jgi:chemotaxis protein MotB
VAKKEQPIIVRKKKGHGHGHHGGAWKVAYADFVTAMMAFFMVMWLMGSDEETKAAITKYFKDPSSAVRKDSDGIPMGDKSGTGDSILKGGDGEVPEELVQTPSKPVLENETNAEQDSHDTGYASSGDQLQVEIMKFSVLQADLFKPGTKDQWTKSAKFILMKIGKLAAQHKTSKLVIKTTTESGKDSATGSYEFQTVRMVAISNYLVDHRLIAEDRIVTKIEKVKPNPFKQRSVASQQGPKVEFTLQ